MTRISDIYPIKTKPSNDEEKYIIEEAKAWLDENAFSSCLGSSPHIDNVVALGKKNTDFLMKLIKENNHKEGMYSHFLLAIMFTLYKEEIQVEGYLGVDGCMSCLIQIYDDGLMTNDYGKTIEVKGAKI